MKYYFKVLKNYATFKGRASRSEYWYFVLFNIIALFVLGFILGFIGRQDKINDLTILYQLAIILPSIAVGVRRIHDVGKSGWFTLIPIYNLILFVTNGIEGENEYGDDPKSNAGVSSKKISTHDSSNSLKEIEKLHELLKSGAITQEEFDQQKQKRL